MSGHGKGCPCYACQPVEAALNSVPVCPCSETVDVECEIPAGLSHTGARRKKVCAIDRCLAPLILALQAAGIGTEGCCCGHGKYDGTVCFENGIRLIVVWPWDEVDQRPIAEIRAELQAAGVDVDAFIRLIRSTVTRLTKNAPAVAPDRIEVDPYHTPEYAAFVDEMAKHCHCTHGPCDGVLVGGLCDGIVEDDQTGDGETL